jgi:hypothetical protein
MVSELMVPVAQTLFGWIGVSGVGSVYFMAFFFSTAIGIMVATGSKNSVGFMVGFLGGLTIFSFFDMFELWILIVAGILIAFIYTRSQGGGWSPR